MTYNPSALHTFHFDAGTKAFVEDDLDPSSSQLALKVGVDLSAVAVTGRFLLLHNTPTSVGLSIVDSLTGVELPRATTSVGVGNGITATADGQFAFVVSLDMPAVLSVFDLCPSSPTLEREVRRLTLPVLATTTAVNSAASVLDGSGRLFVPVVEQTPSGSQTRIHSVDVSNPLAPAVLSTTTAPTVGSHWQGGS